MSGSLLLPYLEFIPAQGHKGEPASAPTIHGDRLGSWHFGSGERISLKIIIMIMVIDKEVIRSRGWDFRGKIFGIQHKEKHSGVKFQESKAH